MAANKIDQDFYQWAKGIVETPLLSRAVTLLYGKADVAFDQLSIADRQQLTNWIFEQYPPLEPHRLYGKQGTLYAKHYYAFQHAVDLGEEHFMELPDTVIQSSSGDFVMQDVFPSIMRIPDDRLKEYLFAETLVAYFQILVGDQSWLESHLEFFYDLFPNTKYRDALNWSFENNANVRSEKIETIQKPAPTDGPPVAANGSDHWVPLIMDDQWHLESLKNDMQDQLSGKDLYIDIWATWCQPCLEEIAYQAQTDSLLAANGLERLYISIDKTEDEDEWLYMVFDLQIGGYHVRAGETLLRQLGTELGFGNDPIVIPRFLLVKNGRIIEKTAARPSEFEVLQRQVERYFGDR
ncbi:MAG: hypothetical protein R2824_29800 [Saprospiraceae bacterium]